MGYLTADRVNATVRDVLFRPDELNSKGQPIVDSVVMVDGFLEPWGFHAERLEDNRNTIKKLLMEIPDEFFDVGGGGWSCKNLCKNNKGEDWTDSELIIEALVYLGLATGYLEYCHPKSEWRKIAGSPYVVCKGLKLKTLNVKTANELLEEVVLPEGDLNGNWCES